MKRRILGNIQPYPAVNPVAASVAAVINGVVIDRVAALPTQPSQGVGYLAFTSAAGIYNSACLLIANGASTGAPTTQSVTVKLQHGTLANGSDMVDVPVAAYVSPSSALTADNTNSNADIDLAGLNRYVRAVVTIAFTGGTTPAQFVAASLIFGDSQNDPAN